MPAASKGCSYKTNESKTKIDTDEELLNYEMNEWIIKTFLYKDAIFILDIEIQEGGVRAIIFELIGVSYYIMFIFVAISSI